MLIILRTYLSHSNSNINTHTHTHRHVRALSQPDSASTDKLENQSSRTTTRKMPRLQASFSVCQRHRRRITHTHTPSASAAAAAAAVSYACYTAGLVESLFPFRTNENMPFACARLCTQTRWHAHASTQSNRVVFATWPVFGHAHNAQRTCLRWCLC